MAVTAEQLAEAREAVAAATKRYPTLTANGVDGDTECVTPLISERGLEQVATAIAYLRLCTPTKQAKLKSYGLKHLAEAWGATQGLSPYVSNGALIAAAVYLGFPTRPDCYCFGVYVGPGLNLLVGVAKSSLPEARR